MTIGIVVALPEEQTTLTRERLKKGEVFRLRDKVLVCYSGAGRKNAGFAASALINQGAERLISWGCAGGLNPLLKPGDLILAAECLTADGVVLATDQAWREGVAALLPAALSPIQSRLVEGRGIVAGTAEKAALAQTSGAEALDMESAAVAEIANASKLPFIAIRAIADPANMALPKAVTQSLNEQGDVEIVKLVKTLLLHPSQIVGLIRLALHFNRAKATLKQVAGYLGEIAA